MNISQTKLSKPLSVHESTHQMQTYCERKYNHGTVPISDYTLNSQQKAGIEGHPTPSPKAIQIWSFCNSEGATWALQNYILDILLPILFFLKF